MPQFELKMPKLGESVEQATIIRWFIKEGDTVEEDIPLLEIATDKVDSEIPSPVEGTVLKLLFKQNDVVPVGAVIALIGDPDSQPAPSLVSTSASNTPETPSVATKPKVDVSTESKSSRFYSPLVKSMAKQESITADELDGIVGTGTEGRVRKEDVLSFLNARKLGGKTATITSSPPATPINNSSAAQPTKVSVSIGAEDTIIEMDRMRKLIAEHMVNSKNVSAHVTAMVEADVTDMAEWREKNKDAFQKRYGQKLTFMPMFTEAVAKALRDFPMVNTSIDGDKVIIRKHVNIGIAVALPTGNLIVPVVIDADLKNIGGLATDINTLATKARENKLSADDIQGGTFTITNFGSFRNLMGTPIINQPQVAILATGSIEKKPAVLETKYGDIIVVRQKMFLSLSYDHRIVDGALGGAFLRKIADYLEQFDPSTSI